MAKKSPPKKDLPLNCPVCLGRYRDNRARDLEGEYYNKENLVCYRPNSDTYAGERKHNVLCLSCRLTFREERRDVFAKYFGERHAKDFFPSCA